MKSITPINRPLVVGGKLIYDESARAFALIRLKKRVIDFFPQLRSESFWMYQMEYRLDYTNLIERIKEAQEKNEGVPLLLFIHNDDTRTETQ